MKRILALLAIVFSFQSDLFALQSLQMEIPVYSVVQTITNRSPEPAEEKLNIQQWFVSLSWQRLDSDPSDLSPPKLISGGIYLLQQPPMPGSSVRRRKGILSRPFLARIDQQGDSWKSFEMAYRVAVDHTGDITKIGTIEVNYFVDKPTSYFIRGLHDAALTAVHLMGLFRRETIDNRSILLGTLEPDGRIGPVFGMLSEKVALLIPLAEQILIPSGQLATLDPTVMHQLQQHGTKVLEVDNLEQAYQLMVRTR
jgi:hypothetical protein